MVYFLKMLYHNGFNLNGNDFRVKADKCTKTCQIKKALKICLNFESQLESNFQDRRTGLNSVKWDLLSSLWDHKSLGVIPPTIPVLSCLMLIPVPLVKNHFHYFALIFLILFFPRRNPCPDLFKGGKMHNLTRWAITLKQTISCWCVHFLHVPLSEPIFDLRLLLWSACASIICVWCRTLHTMGLSAAECFVQHNTKASEDVAL